MGQRDNFLDVAGLFKDERNPAWPIAPGYGWTGLARDDPGGAVDYAALTCGACHVGRVRLDDGSYRYLDGGVNTQFNLVQYRVRVANHVREDHWRRTTTEEKIEARHCGDSRRARQGACGKPKLLLSQFLRWAPAGSTPNMSRNK